MTKAPQADLDHLPAITGGDPPVNPPPRVPLAPAPRAPTGAAPAARGAGDARQPLR